jgi:RHS repeat-associated protein
MQRTSYRLEPGTAGTATAYAPELLSATDYFPFGMQMPGRVVVEMPEGYRYGFNGMEKENAVNEDGYDFGARLYNSWNGKFLSIDPYSAKFPSESNYIFAGNNPIYFIDFKGKYKYPADMEAEYRKTYPMITLYLEQIVVEDIKNNPRIRMGYQSVNKHISREHLIKDATWDSGPEIQFHKELGEFPNASENIAGEYVKGGPIYLNARYAKYVDNLLADNNVSDQEKMTAFMRLFMTLIHETAHSNNQYGQKYIVNGNEIYKPIYIPKDKTNEDGLYVEEFIWGGGAYMPYSDSKVNYDESTISTNAQGIEGSEKYQMGVTENVINEQQNKTNGVLPTLPKK